MNPFGNVARGPGIFATQIRDGYLWVSENNGPYRRISAGSSAAAEPPATGDWLRGDILWNSAPEPGGVVGWICVESGAPGTWYPWGLISQ